MSWLRGCVCAAVCAWGAGVMAGQTVRFAEPSELKAEPMAGGEHVTLNVEMGTLHQWNVVTGKQDTLRLRTYNGQAVGPTIRVKPGETFGMTLANRLGKTIGCDGMHHPDPNRPHCFDYTNMHTHGLHVSPSGHSDNVLLTVKPGETMEYAFALPETHPAGTFWYHAHRHGSTALQVSSGMEGALIVEGTRTYADRAKNHGLADIDTVLRNADGTPVEEHVAIFQQVQYSCWGEATPGSCVDAAGKPIVGEISDYRKGQFGPGTWATSMRYTTVNGALQPIIPAVAGKLYRFRMIHGGVRETIGVHVSASNVKALPGGGLTPAQSDAWVAQHCGKGDVPQFELATDGITRPAMSEKTFNVLQPGYRSDVVTAFPKAGVYCVTDDDLPAPSEINERSLASGAMLLKSAPAPRLRERKMLALVEVTGTAVVKGPLREYVGAQLFAGNPTLDAAVREKLRRLDTAAFEPLPDLSTVPAGELGHQENVFNIQLQPTLEFQVNGRPYAPGRVDRTLTLGKVDEWNISSEFDGHPFHIHVNSFQIEDILNAQGQSIWQGGRCTEMYLKDKTGKPAPDPQYCDMRGTYRDTIFVKENYHIVTRTKYDDFTGEFVLHCHILDHEDQGMMQNIRIVRAGEVDDAPFGHGMAMEH